MSTQDVWAAVALVRDWYMQKKRPLLVDLADGPCDICSQKHKAGCQICGSQDRPEIGWYVSPEEHFHITMVEGIAARAAISTAVCAKCYREDFLRSYPGQDCPI